MKGTIMFALAYIMYTIAGIMGVYIVALCVAKFIAHLEKKEIDKILLISKREDEAAQKAADDDLMAIADAAGVLSPRMRNVLNEL